MKPLDSGIAARKRVRLAASLAACAAAVSFGCAGTGPREPDRAWIEPPAAAARMSWNPSDAAARALLVSPRVAAAAHRVEAAAARERAVAVPPDPSLALAVGIPLDGLGGTGLSGSISLSIAWLFARDRLAEEAAHERELAARELLLVSVETAAEARRVARACVAAEEAVRAARAASEARASIARAAGEALRLGEGSRWTLAELEAAGLESDARVAELEARRDAEFLALASALALDAVPDAARLDVEAEMRAAMLTDAAAAPTTDRTEPSCGPVTIEVLRAREAWLDAKRALADLQSPLGSDATLDAGVERDLEGREAADVGAEITIPLFRRSHEAEAATRAIEAAAADLAEAERDAALRTRQAQSTLAHARRALCAAFEATRRAEAALTAATEAHALGELTTRALEDARVALAERRIERAERFAEVAAQTAALERVLHRGLDEAQQHATRVEPASIVRRTGGAS